jgi:short-subunit dehydrogenase
MAIPLQNQTIIITGASSGIGEATALACAEAGLNVLLTGRNTENLARVADAIRALGRRAEVVTGDITAPGFSAHLLNVADETLDGFYAVFANAGYGFRKAEHETDLAELRRIFDVNFFASCELLFEAARRLIARSERGHLLMCSSALAKFTMRNFGAYSASKAAQNHICRAMRMELRPHHIAVSSVHPITTRTEFFVRVAEHAGHNVNRADAYRHTPSFLVQSPQRVARAVVACLRRPRAEVWTSPLVRLVSGLVTIFPSWMDVLGTRM